MGKVIVTIESQPLNPQLLLVFAKGMIPPEEDWHKACMQYTGVVPEHIVITYEVVPEEYKHEDDFS